MKQRVATLTLAATLLVAGTAATAPAAGGLSIAPAILEHEARPGTMGQIRLTNGSAAPIAITVAARPWRQARSGAVAPAAGRTLPQIRLGAARFTLGAGQSRLVPVTLTARPSSGSLYGAVEALGVPRSGSGAIKLRYRLIGGLRLTPSAADRRLRVRVGAVSGGRGAVLAVRNLGNTAEPITGSARIAGASGTVRGTIAATRIVPGAVVDLRMWRGRLQPGRYSAAVTLRQGGRVIARTSRSFRVAG